VPELVTIVLRAAAGVYRVTIASEAPAHVARVVMAAFLARVVTSVRSCHAATRCTASGRAAARASAATGRATTPARAATGAAGATTGSARAATGPARPAAGPAGAFAARSARTLSSRTGLAATAAAAAVTFVVAASDTDEQAGKYDENERRSLGCAHWGYLRKLESSAEGSVY
jgi:hypothetical protein